MDNMVLSGVRVFELTQVISGSVCGMLLGDLGATVIKAERPGTGEFYRSQAIKNSEGISLVYPNYNRNKQSVTLNVQTEKGVELCRELICNSDVFIENYRAGSLARYGLGYEDLKKINPKIIMVSITGFGQEGPYARKPAYDMTVSAMSGFMSVNGPEGEPTKSGPAISDFLSGIYGAMAVLVALLHRDKTGEGQYVDVAMMDCSISILDAFIAQLQFTGVEPRGTGNRRANYAPVNAFKTQDGSVYLSCSTERQWQNLIGLMKRDDLLENSLFRHLPDRKKNELQIEQIVSDWASGFKTDELIAALEEHDVPCAPVNSIESVVKDPQVVFRNTIRTFDYPGLGAYPSVPFVPRFSTIKTAFERASQLGEHNKEVYCEILGLSESEFAALEEKGII